jgi:branched-chain amino acid transport system ATP-binding protein
MGEVVLSVEGLSVSYGDFLAVQRADFHVEAGECVAVVGPNGNGKSSIALALAGLTASTGTVELFGQRTPRGNPVWMVKHGLVLVPERRQLFPTLSVIDNVLLGTYGFTHSLRRSRDSTSVAEALALFPELADRHRQLAGTLSGGQQQMVAVARGVASGAKILMIDEPCLGLAEIVSIRVYEALRALKDEGRTIVLIEENPLRALRISDRAIRVTNGVAVEEVVDARTAS